MKFESQRKQEKARENGRKLKEKKKNEKQGGKIQRKRIEI